MSQTNVELRKAPVVPWRIKLPPEPKEPEIFAQVRYEATHWYLITMLALIVIIGKWVSTWHTSSFIGYLVITGILTAICALVLWTPITRWIPELLPRMRQARKQYNQDLVKQAEEVIQLCKKAADPIRQLWFPFCKHEENDSKIFCNVVWWRTGDNEDSIAKDNFRIATFQGGTEREVNFPKCHYQWKDGKFQWGDTVIIRSPKFL